jgi:hypothetical protein
VKVRTEDTLHNFFAEAAKNASQVDVWIDHPSPDFQFQTGVCYQAAAEYMMIGPEGSPARVCIPYHAIRWFRAIDN